MNIRSPSTAFVCLAVVFLVALTANTVGASKYDPASHPLKILNDLPQSWEEGLEAIKSVHAYTRQQLPPSPHGHLRTLASSSRESRISTEYGTSEHSERLRNAIPRFGYPDTVEEAEDDPEGYAMGIGILAAFGIIMAVLTLLWMIFFCIIRCCGNCCKCCGKNDKELTPMRHRLVIGILVLAFIISIFAMVGLTYNEKIHDDVADSDTGIASIAVDLTHETELILENRIVKTIRRVEERIPIAVELVLNLTDTFGDIIETGFSNITSSMEGLRDHLYNNSLTNNEAVGCDFCIEVGDQFNESVTDFKASGTDVVQSFRDGVADVEEEIVDQQADIEEQIDDVIDTIRDVKNTTRDAREDILEYNEDVEKYDDYRRIFILILLLAPLSAVLFAAGGWFFKSPYPFTCMYFIGFLAMFLMWLMFAIHLPLAVVLSDGCVYADQLEVDFRARITDNVTAQTINACLDNTTLFDIYNLSAVLNFTNDINFSDQIASDPDEYLPVDAFFNATDKIEQQLDATDVLFNQTYLDESVEGFNALTGLSMTEEEINETNPDPSSLDSQEEALRDSIVALKEVKATFNDAVETFTNNTRILTASIEDSVNGTRSLIISAQQAVVELEEEIKVLANINKDVRRITFCGFLGKFYKKLKTRVCVDTVEGLSTMALCLFFIAILLIPMQCMAIILSRHVEPVAQDPLVPNSGYELQKESVQMQELPPPQGQAGPPSVEGSYEPVQSQSYQQK